MRLVAELDRLLSQEDSPFRAQLLREDLDRLRRLEAMARAEADRAAFVKAGSRIGWTPGDARTAELREPLQALLEAVFDLEKEGATSRREADAARAWSALWRLRLERLVGCLSTRIPPPLD